MTTDPRGDAARSTALGALLIATASVLAVAGTELGRPAGGPRDAVTPAQAIAVVTAPAPGLVPAPRPRRVVVVRRSRSS